jgi:hypothetical protein
MYSFVSILMSFTDLMYLFRLYEILQSLSRVLGPYLEVCCFEFKNLIKVIAFSYGIQLLM